MTNHDKLASSRMVALGDHLSSGDEWNLVNVQSEDLGLPASTREVRVLFFSYAGPPGETRREQRVPSETTIEYGFGLTLTVEAEMHVADADAHGWKHEPTSDGLAVVTADLDMHGRAGVTYTDDEVTGFIEYIGLSRADGTTGHPLAPKYGEGAHARIYPFRKREEWSGSARPRTPLASGLANPSPTQTALNSENASLRVERQDEKGVDRPS